MAREAADLPIVAGGRTSRRPAGAPAMPSALPCRALADAPAPLGAHWDGRGTHFAVFAEHAEQVQLCLFDASGHKELRRVALPECTDGVWHGYLPDVAPGQALRLSRAGSLSARTRSPLQFEQTAARSLCAPPRGLAALERCALWLSHRLTARGSVVRSARQCTGHAEGRRHRGALRLGRRSAAADPLVRDASSTRRICAD